MLKPSHLVIIHNLPLWWKPLLVPRVHTLQCNFSQCFDLRKLRWTWLLQCRRRNHLQNSILNWLLSFRFGCLRWECHVLLKQKPKKNKHVFCIKWYDVIAHCFNLWLIYLFLMSFNTFKTWSFILSQVFSMVYFLQRQFKFEMCKMCVCNSLEQNWIKTSYQNVICPET